jgi:cation diffusion facilitator CzcD-associated flavoprotein CzcO
MTTPNGLTNRNTSTTRLHVLIIGGGAGGLCLAQSLKKAGVSVAVLLLNSYLWTSW